MSQSVGQESDSHSASMSEMDLHRTDTAAVGADTVPLDDLPVESELGRQRTTTSHLSVSDARQTAVIFFITLMQLCQM
jgi:hypothetical protein